MSAMMSALQPVSTGRNARSATAVGTCAAAIAAALPAGCAAGRFQQTPVPTPPSRPRRGSHQCSASSSCVGRCSRRSASAGCTFQRTCRPQPTHAVARRAAARRTRLRRKETRPPTMLPSLRSWRRLHGSGCPSCSCAGLRSGANRTTLRSPRRRQCRRCRSTQQMCWPCCCCCCCCRTLTHAGPPG